MPSIERLMELDETVKAKLIQAEIIAVVLYTGPMVNSDFALVMTFENSCVIPGPVCAAHDLQHRTSAVPSQRIRETQER